MAPGWVEHAVWWHVYPLGFSGGGGLGRLESWLDYAIELGCSGLALGPIFASQTHGYDTVDYFRIDPRLGDEEDFDHLVVAAKQRGLRLLLDGVFNHVGRSFPRFQQALSDGPDSESGRWFRWQAGRPAVFEGHEQLVALNHEEPAVAGLVGDVMEHWLERGADGWRLDAAYAVPDRFWRPVIDRVRARYDQAWWVAEVIHGDYAGRVVASGYDSVTQYELWKATWSAINDANWFELAWAIQRHDQWVKQFAPMTFIGNHDVTRIASRIEDPRHLAHALVVLLTLPGVPSVYYGDEQAFRGIKEERAGGDDAVRPAFPAGPAELPPEGWPTYRLHQELIGLRRRHPWLHRASVQIEETTNQTLVYRCAAGSESLRVGLNLADAPMRVAAQDGTQEAVVLARPGRAGAGGADGTDNTVIEIDGHGWAIWR
ncbi:MAG TPA: alpha-amylase family protein [Acidimicrobiales bacterium]|nr:alpha-amylase family protein [Acidimicrobiales bacterium]